MTVCKFTISVRKGHMEMGQFWVPESASVINGAIFNRFASNLDCTHDFKVSSAGEQERQIWGQFVPLLGF